MFDYNPLGVIPAQLRTHQIVENSSLGVRFLKIKDSSWTKEIRDWRNEKGKDAPLCSSVLDNFISRERSAFLLI